MLDMIQIDCIKNEIKKNINDTFDLFEEVWGSVIVAYTLWLDTVGKLTSDQTQRLELVKLLCDKFKNIKIKDNETIKQIILSSALPIGSKVKLKDGKGSFAEFKVVGREISDRFGINYVMESPDGTRFTREFFD